MISTMTSSPHPADDRPEKQLPLPRVLIVDDHPVFADGLATLLSREALADNVAQVNSVTAAVQDLRVHPDTTLVLLDLTLPGEGGLALFRELDRHSLLIPVVVISSHDDEASVRSAQAAGALGFVPKSADRRMLIDMVRHVQRGDTYYPPGMETTRHLPGLTPRQRDVLQLLAEGFPNKRICQELDLTDHTVKSHLKAIFAVLDVHNRTECVTRARALGLI